MGKPEAVAKALEEESAKLTGQSKDEYDAALPHLAALVRENFVKAGSGYGEPVIEFSASGSGTARPATPGGAVENVQRQVSVTLKPVWTKLLT